jgi:hypothetical protein
MGKVMVGVFDRRAAAVTYRCTLPTGREGALSLKVRPEAATLSDAWLRLTARFGDFDPTTIEIEIREGLREVATGAPADQRRSVSVPCL